MPNCWMLTNASYSRQFRIDTLTQSTVSPGNAKVWFGRTFDHTYLGLFISVQQNLMLRILHDFIDHAPFSTDNSDLPYMP